MAATTNFRFLLSPANVRARDMVLLAQNAHLRVGPDVHRPLPALRIGAYPSIWAPTAPAVVASMGSSIDRNDVLINGPDIEPLQCAFLLRPDNGVVMFIDYSHRDTSQVFGENSTPFCYVDGAAGPQYRVVALFPHFNKTIGMGVVPGGGGVLFDILWPDSPYPRSLNSERWPVGMSVSPGRWVPRIGAEPKSNKLTLQCGRRQIRHREIETVGRGSYGVVSMAVDVDTGDLLVVKSVRNDDPTSEAALIRGAKELRQEAEVLRECQHAHIIEFIQLSVSNNTDNLLFLQPMPALLMSLKQGDLHSLVVQFYGNPRLRPGIGILADTVCLHMLRALAFLAEKQVAHRDVKPENILFISVPAQYRQPGSFSSAAPYHFQLTDFGCSQRWSDSKWAADDGVGTPCFVAPERVWPRLGSPQPPVSAEEFCKQDVWGLFVTLLWTVELDGFVATHFAPAMELWGKVMRREPLATKDRLLRAIYDFYLAAEGCGHGGSARRWMSMARLKPTKRASAADMLRGS